MEYVFLWLHSFAAATLLPIGSEPTLLVLLEKGYNPLLLLLFATVGNTAGAVVNWVIGRYLLRFKGASWFPISNESLMKAQKQFSRRGVWVLLLAWLPVLGDPLTLVAGILRVNLATFVILVGFGKCMRYMVFVFPYWL
ncbi:MAG: DedA family protein [Pseudomonadales bacterium]|nr:DedA family protein [Pseudomonadales bacterium]